MNKCIGVDVSKGTLDCFCTQEEQSQDEPNTGCGIKKIVHWVKHRRPDYVVMESTGAYHLELAKALDAARIQVCIVQPSRIRRFAEAMGQLAKTDPIDARMIAEYGQVAKLRPYVFESKQRQVLDNLRRRREQLMNMRVAEYSSPTKP